MERGGKIQSVFFPSTLHPPRSTVWVGRMRQPGVALRTASCPARCGWGVFWGVKDMSIIDSILNDTDSSKVRVVSEQNDTSKITVEVADVDRAIAGLSGARTWDAVEYGISREQAAAMIKAADTPEARERVMKDLQARALRRASLDTTGGKVRAAFAGKAPWHGLGTVVEGDMNSEEAIMHSGMGWTVVKQQLTFTWNGFPSDANSWGIIRQDTGAYLGTVGSRYVPVQNEEGFKFLDSVIGEFGARYESAGSIYGGKSVWMLAHMPRNRFTINGDTIEPYVLFTNCHDGSGSAWCFPTTVRVECANTFRTASREKSKGMSIRHTGNIKCKIDSAREALGLAVEGFEQFKNQAEVLVSKKVDAKVYANSVLDEILEITQADIVAGERAFVEKTGFDADEAYQFLRSKIERRGEILDDIMTRYESERCHPKGTAWAAFNAITEHADHNTIGKQASDKMTRLSRRMESTMAGERDRLKQIAFTRAMAL